MFAKLASMSANAAAAELNARNLATPTGRPWLPQTVIRAVAAGLNERGIRTPRGTGQWQAGTVAQLLARLPA